MSSDTEKAELVLAESIMSSDKSNKLSDIMFQNIIEIMGPVMGSQSNLLKEILIGELTSFKYKDTPLTGNDEIDTYVIQSKTICLFELNSRRNWFIIIDAAMKQISEICDIMIEMKDLTGKYNLMGGEKRQKGGQPLIEIVKLFFAILDKLNKKLLILMIIFSIAKAMNTPSDESSVATTGTSGSKNQLATGDFKGVVFSSDRLNKDNFFIEAEIFKDNPLANATIAEMSKKFADLAIKRADPSYVVPSSPEPGSSSPYDATLTPEQNMAIASQEKGLSDTFLGNENYEISVRAMGLLIGDLNVCMSPVDRDFLMANITETFDILKDSARNLNEVLAKKVTKFKTMTRLSEQFEDYLKKTPYYKKKGWEFESTFIARKEKLESNLNILMSQLGLEKGYDAAWEQFAMEAFRPPRLSAVPFEFEKKVLNKDGKYEQQMCSGLQAAVLMDSSFTANQKIRTWGMTTLTESVKYLKNKLKDPNIDAQEIAKIQLQLSETQGWLDIFEDWVGEMKALGDMEIYKPEQFGRKVREVALAQSFMIAEVKDPKSRLTRIRMEIKDATDLQIADMTEQLGQQVVLNKIMEETSQALVDYRRIEDRTFKYEAQQKYWDDVMVSIYTWCPPWVLGSCVGVALITLIITITVGSVTGTAATGYGIITNTPLIGTTIRGTMRNKLLKVRNANEEQENLLENERDEDEANEDAAGVLRIEGIEGNPDNLDLDAARGVGNALNQAPPQGLGVFPGDDVDEGAIGDIHNALGPQLGQQNQNPLGGRRSRQTKKLMRYRKTRRTGNKTRKNKKQRKQTKKRRRQIKNKKNTKRN